MLYEWDLIVQPTEIPNYKPSTVTFPCHLYHIIIIIIVIIISSSRTTTIIIVPEQQVRCNSKSSCEQFIHASMHPCIHASMHPFTHASMHPFTCLRISSKTAAPTTSTAERQTLPITASLLLLLLLEDDGNGLDLFSLQLSNGWW